MTEQFDGRKLQNSEQSGEISEARKSASGRVPEGDAFYASAAPSGVTTPVVVVDTSSQSSATIAVPAPQPHTQAEH